MTIERDAFRRPVPDRLAAVFAGRRRLVRFATQLRRLLEDVPSLEKMAGAEAVDLVTLRQSIRTAASIVERATPLTACDCHARDNCSWCENRRWLTAAAAALKAETTPVPS